MTKSKNVGQKQQKNWLGTVRKQPDKYLFYALLAAFLISMVPVLYLSRYTVPGCDDYTYGVRTHGAWLDTHSLTAVLRAALDTTVEYWHQWQGTYSSIFLMTLSPGILDEKWYFLTTFIMAGMLCTSIAVLVHVVLKKYVAGGHGTAADALPGGKQAQNRDTSRQAHYRRGSCILVLLFLAVQTMVAPSDGLYWYNGALHYVFMESMLFFQAALLLAFTADNRDYGDGKEAVAGTKRPVTASGKYAILQAVRLLLSVFLAFVLGGANLLTGLQSCILMVLLLLYSFWRRHGRKAAERWKESGSWHFFGRQLLILIPLLVNFAGFAANVLAPGNSVRETTAEGMGAIQAILLSFYWAAVFVTEWLTPIVLVGFLLLSPVIWKLVKEAETKFFAPLAAVGLSFCVFAAMFTPTLYATSSEGPDRCKNVMRIVLYLLVFFNLVNTFGWFSQNRREGLLARLQEAVQKSYFPWLAVCTVGMGCIFLLAADKNTYVSVSALRSLANGEAVQYYEENRERLALYHDEGQPDITIHYLTAKPYLLFKEDVGNEGSPDYWINISVTDYYRKNRVTVE